MHFAGAAAEGRSEADSHRLVGLPVHALSAGVPCALPLQVYRSSEKLMRFIVLPTVLLGVFLPMLGGCVPQARYDDLMTAFRSTEQQLLACQSELENCRSNENALRGQLGRAADDLRSLEAYRDGERGDIDRLIADYEALLRQLDELKIGPLPQQVESDLAALAAQFPDLMTFDARRGMLRFAADFTFDLGEATLKPDAAQLIRRLAPILNGGEARGLEVKVIGHTDTVPIRRQATLAKHPTNVHLSAHRAIAVRDALVSAGVAANRFQVAGYGEFRPVVANAAQGAAANRRVEVFLSPMTASAPLGVAPAPATQPAATTPPRQPRRDDEPLK